MSAISWFFLAWFLGWFIGVGLFLTGFAIHNYLGYYKRKRLADEREFIRWINGKRK